MTTIQKHTTQYEVTDSNRAFEFSGGSYRQSFTAFIESLGYEIAGTESWSDDFNIDGVVFAIDLGNASYMSKNPFTRKQAVRKPENRYISLRGKYHDKAIFRIHFNKEYDVKKLRSKIDAHIAYSNQLREDRRIRDFLDNQNTKEIAMHYLWNNQVEAALRSIMIDKGQLHFHFKSMSSIVINLQDDTMEAYFHINKMKSLDDVSLFAREVPQQAKEFDVICDLIYRTVPISDDLKEWSMKQYNRYFYIDSMSTEWNAPKVN